MDDLPVVVAELRSEFRTFSAQVVADLNKMTDTLQALVEQNTRIALLSQRVDVAEKAQNELFKLARSNEKALHAHEQVHADDTKEELKGNHDRIHDLVWTIAKALAMLAIGILLGVKL